MATEGNSAAMVQLKSETDFSAKADDFIELAQKMADAVLARGPEAVSELNDELDSLKLAKRENIEIGSAVRFEAADGNLLDAYLHVQDLSLIHIWYKSCWAMPTWRRPRSIRTSAGNACGPPCTPRTPEPERSFAVPSPATLSG